MKPTHDYFEHDADIGIIGRGETLEASFENAARAMFAIQCEIDSIRPIEQVEVNFDENEAELALVRWLNALLAASREHGLALCDFGLVHAGEHWRGWACGGQWGGRVARGTEVKGATLTMLSVAHVPGGWEARCVVDV